MSKPKEYSWMTKDKLMMYTAIALAVLVGLSVIPFGYTSILVALIAVGVAVGIDLLLSKLATDAQPNILSAAVFGLVVACSYTLGLPTQGITPPASYPLNVTMQGLGIYLFPALISVVGMVLFKKGMKSRKLVNPAAAAKLLVLVFLLAVALTPVEHLQMFPNLQSSLTLNVAPEGQLVPFGFGVALQQCFAQSFSAYTPDFSGLVTTTQSDVLYTLSVMKYHGWLGGVSSIAVLAVGIALFIVARRYIKWRITAAYLVTTAVVAFALSFVYADGDPILRAAFHLFIGSSIFLAFFMATDPATTPLTFGGQAVFGVGLGVLSVLIVTYMNGFYGGSILALVIMNLTTPLLDKVGRLKPTTESKEPKLPKAMKQTAPKLYECIRCGACMRVCCHKLSPILIKQAFDKTDVETLSKLNADYCTGCGHCSYVCPSRIDLKGSVLRAKAMLRVEGAGDNEIKGAAIEVPKVAIPKVEAPKAAIEETVAPDFKIVDSAHGHVIERIVPAHAKKLNSLKIFTSSDLLEAGATPIARKDLAAKTGISDSLILKYVNIADLLRIEGIGEKYANLLEVSGVDTVVELARRIPENLHAKMTEVNEKQQLVERTPTLAGVTKWISDAKALPRRIEY